MWNPSQRQWQPSVVKRFCVVATVALNYNTCHATKETKTANPEFVARLRRNRPTCYFGETRSPHNNVGYADDSLPYSNRKQLDQFSRSDKDHECDGQTYGQNCCCTNASRAKNKQNNQGRIYPLINKEGNKLSIYEYINNVYGASFFLNWIQAPTPSSSRPLIK